ncbi:hypothetical protein RBEAN4_0142 [Rickettsia bellii str. RML An4]|uniref:Uncharacterized protein n=1 Tax=Rickettsia bellii str. RML An4 TaxID=1359193 RepID=A0A0F3QCN6_RICBE|nr:hypothetical protein RBEAN4_0142 [Rickettsia bellii str. RML An4]
MRLHSVQIVREQKRIPKFDVPNLEISKVHTMIKGQKLLLPFKF